MCLVVSFAEDEACTLLKSTVRQWHDGNVGMLKLVRCIGCPPLALGLVSAHARVHGNADCESHTLTVIQKAVRWAFCDGEHGAIGLDENDSLVPTHVDPQRFAGAQVAKVAAGTCNSAAVTEGNALFTGGKVRVSQVSGSFNHETRKNGYLQVLCHCLLILS